MKDERDAFDRLDASMRHLKWMHVAMVVLLLTILVRLL
jgi:hypothetical protein